MSTDEKICDAVEFICEKLSERQAVLFTGAGLNADIRNNDGKIFPLAGQLSNWIAEDLLEDPELKIPLDSAAEMAIMKIGRTELNKYIYEQFTTFRPSTAHLSLVQLPWDIIFTTNYDLLVEEAGKLPSITSDDHIKAVVSKDTELAEFSEGDILYYKLHGSIDLANSEGRLIITKEDYRFYNNFRRPLFLRLKRDLISRTFVFVGYSFEDRNFREVLDDCRKELKIEAFPLSFAVRPGFSKVEEEFWREKYNIHLLDIDSSHFLDTLKVTWQEQERRVSTYEERRARTYIQVDDTSRFAKVGESFYLIKPEDCTGHSNPKLFFKGAEPSWADIRDQVPAERDLYWTLFEAIFPELEDPAQSCSAYLITGAAGTGKTTLVRSLVYDISKSFGIPVLVHIYGTPLDIQLLSPFVSEANPKRIVVVVPHSGEQIGNLRNFLDELNRKRMPVTLVLEERKNQWIGASLQYRVKFSIPEYELKRLSEKEIYKILEALEKNKALGKLTGCSRKEMVDHFKSLAEKELLVALRELTEQTTFDQIVRDEYAKIPTQEGKQAYLYASAIGQIDQAVRFETLVHLLGIGFTELRDKVFTPTTGILLTCEETGRSRHNAGFRVRARHPIIASIVFDSELPDDEAKFSVLNDIIEFLDPGYREDKQLLRHIVQERSLVCTMESKDKRRAFYDRLATVLPENPYVYQQRSILEKEMGYPDLSLEYAQTALNMDKNNNALKNTYGLALENSARHTKDPLRKEAYLREADKIFSECIRRNTRDAYSYLGKVYVRRQRAEMEKDKKNKSLMKAEALAILEEAYDATSKSSMIASELAIQKKVLGSPRDAKILLESALKQKPTDERLRDILIRFETQSGHPEEAIKYAIEGATIIPTSWRFQLHLARLKRRNNDSVEAIKGHYQSTLRHRKGDLLIMVEYGSFLFIERQYKEANIIFQQAKTLPIRSQEKRVILVWHEDESGNAHIFNGRIKHIKGAGGWLEAIPENFEAFFWRTHTKLGDLKQGDSVSFKLGFNAYGPFAWILTDLI
jgi:Tfp pilus assembly protein PilF